MRHPLLILLFLAALLSGCSSFRPVSTVRNPSRASGTTETVEARPHREKPAAKPVARKATPPVLTGSTAAVRGKLITEAERFIGVRYKYGGNNPREGFDCSGFVKYLYNDQGLDIHRVSRDQARQGTQINASAAKPGDLVFYRRGANQPVFHVSMVVATGPGEIWVIHPTSSRGVIRENILASSYWKPKIYTIRTLIQ
ncbi:cell wall-associated NlpC family hydrolase [Lewinella aquimaris]|uniref:Cell wall-associated NlpC family hydrolase n=1 Tax=Neolewinella aquimaris TaxID=1835722 RepID=A0A840E9Y8_9BACT|nr:C40 family peptidase [Neolewinella aquimaris]MBB4080187.1 cell wall-associated NlpC family hydrolase [Neolewinella aquimaris]